MFSKWFDSSANLAAFHYQSDYFQRIAPPSFGNHPEVRNFTRNRQRVLTSLTLDEYQAKLESDIIEAAESPRKGGFLKFLKAARKRRKKRLNKPKSIHRRQQSEHKPIRTPDGATRKFPKQGSFLTSPGASFDEGPTDPSASILSGDEAITSPFLQESAHLFSLLSAVALATLRNDIPDVEPPLEKWEPDDPFPPVDPDDISNEIRKEYGEHSSFWAALYFLTGLSRSPVQRTLYNHARPFKVLGGISVREVEALRQARGSYGKVALCFMWIQEFISREQLTGGLGQVPTPIVSRCYQFASDGMKGYNECRKIACIPFPFPHEQLTSIFIMIILWVFPILFYSFVNSMTVACLLNYTTVLCFVGLHEVAREMESPFMRVPNNLPLTTFQAQFNEALITTWAGYHPDSWFDLDEAELPNIADAIAEECEASQDLGMQDWATFLAQKINCPTSVAIDAPTLSHATFLNVPTPATSGVSDSVLLSGSTLVVNGAQPIEKPSHSRRVSFHDDVSGEISENRQDVGMQDWSTFLSQNFNRPTSIASNAPTLSQAPSLNAPTLGTSVVSDSILRNGSAVVTNGTQPIEKPSHSRHVSFQDDVAGENAEPKQDVGVQDWSTFLSEKFNRPISIASDAPTLSQVTVLNAPTAARGEISDSVSLHGSEPEANGAEAIEKPSHSRHVSFQDEVAGENSEVRQQDVGMQEWSTVLSQQIKRPTSVGSHAPASTQATFLNAPTPTTGGVSDSVFRHGSVPVTNGTQPMERPSHSRHVSFQDDVPCEIYSFPSLGEEGAAEP